MNKKYIIKELYNDDNGVVYDSLVDALKYNYNNDVFIGGNNQLSSINYDIIKTIRNDVIDASDYYIELYYNNNYAAFIIDTLKAYKNISLKQALNIIKLIKEYNKKYDDRFNNIKHQLICDILSIIYYNKYTYTLMRGYCQSDWIYCYYNSDAIDNNYIQYIEAVLFNTGIEIYISDNKYDIESQEALNIIDNDIQYDGYSDYIIQYYNSSDKLKAVADIIGCDIEDIAYYEINDVRTITTYKINYREVK